MSGIAMMLYTTVVGAVAGTLQLCSQDVKMHGCECLGKRRGAIAATVAIVLPSSAETPMVFLVGAPPC